MTIRFLSGAAIRASFRYCRDTLSQSASLVPVENMFSTMGLLLNGKRSALAPHRANWLSFIHDNFALYFKTQNENDV